VLTLEFRIFSPLATRLHVPFFTYFEENNINFYRVTSVMEIP